MIELSMREQTGPEAGPAGWGLDLPPVKPHAVALLLHGGGERGMFGPARLSPLLDSHTRNLRLLCRIRGRAGQPVLGAAGRAGTPLPPPHHGPGRHLHAQRPPVLHTKGNIQTKLVVICS